MSDSTTYNTVRVNIFEELLQYPISILPAMCILFERILTEDIYDQLSRNHLITSAQYGFIKGRSTELQLLNCSCDWVNAIDTKCFADTVYIDLAKAFDTVSHTKLLHKLYRNTA